MKKYILLLVLAGCAFAANAQITFQKTYGGTGSDNAKSIEQTLDNGYIIAGMTNTYGAGDMDFYLIKTDVNGDTTWTKTFGGTAKDRAFSVKQTTDGGYIVAGETESFGAGSADVYLIKTDANGNLLWTKTFGGVLYEGAMSVEQTADGGYAIAGNANGLGSGDYDVYLIKTDANGDSLWTKTIGRTVLEKANSFEKTTDGGFIITGWAYSSIANYYDVYLVKTDSAGNLLWAKTIGAASYEEGMSVCQSQDGGYAITGHTFSFGAIDGNIYLNKTDSAGNLLWSKTFGGTGNEYSYSVQPTADSGYILTAYTNSFSAGDFDIYLIKTNSAGNLLWSKTFGGASSDMSSVVRQTADGGYIVLGYTSTFGIGFTDFYLIKTDSLGNSGCNAGNPATIVTTPATIVTIPAAFVTSPATIVTTPATLTGSGGIVTTLCTSTGITPLSLEEEFGVRLSPNPSSGAFQITYTLPYAHPGTLAIIDVTGKTIYTQALPAHSTMQTITLPQVDAGLYNCVIMSGENRVSEKMAVIK